MKATLRTFAAATLGLFAATAVAEAYTLNGDEDWSNRAEAFPATVDLNGHNLTITRLEACTITDSHKEGSGGELHVNVAAGVALDNTDLALEGSLKLVKDGAGTFVAHRKNQTYTGGMQVTGGQFAIWSDGKNNANFWPNNNGTLGSKNWKTIDVDRGAEFNIVGNYGLYRFTIRLNGGKLENTARPVNPVSGSTAFAQTLDTLSLGNVMLTADSEYYVRYEMLQNWGTVDLGGHTLEIGFMNSKTLSWSSVIQNGTINVGGKNFSGAGSSAYFKTIGAVDARTVTFDVYAQFNLEYELSVSNYVSHSANDLENGHQGTAALNVYGTFTPVTDFFYGCTMQDGSTLDLSTRTGAWSTTSLSPTGKREVEFVKGATVNIDLGERLDMRNLRKIVAWSKKPEDVTFKLVPSAHVKDNAWVLLVEDDGIYIRRGLAVLIR